jgi:hypothetical protein
LPLLYRIECRVILMLDWFKLKFWCIEFIE